MPRPRAPLSVIVITLNEAHDIEACIASVRDFANEIVVVDSGSTDGTQTIAARLGARVVETDWPGFGPQKNRALALATHPWVLSIDADERVTPELRASIERVLADAGGAGCDAAMRVKPDALAATTVPAPAHAPAPAGYAISRRSQFCGAWIDHSGWSPDWVVRLFRRDAARFSDDAVHERVLVDGAIGRLDGRLLHYSYRSLAEVDAKTRSYARAGARMMSARGKRVGYFAPLTHGAFAFVRTWLLRAGWLDGSAGFAVARMNARASFLKYRYARDPSAAPAGPGPAAPKLGFSCQALRHSGGFERYARDVIGELVARGMRPTVFARNFDRSLPECASIDAQQIHVKWLPGKLRDFAFAWALPKRRARSGVDALIAVNRVSAAEIVVCGGTHPGALEHGRNRPRWTDRWQIALERRAYGNARIVVAHSRLMADELQRYFGVAADKIRVIHPPVRDDRFTPVDAATRASLRAELGVPDGHAAFAWAANTGKGYETLKAFFETTTLPVVLLAAGRPIESTSPKIRFLGYRTDMENVFRAADFTVISSPYEPFGLVGVESILCGTPLLSATNVGCAEVIRDDAQWRFSHLDPATFAAAVDAALRRWRDGTARLAEPRAHLLYDPRVAPHVTRLLELVDEVMQS